MSTLEELRVRFKPRPDDPGPEPVVYRLLAPPEICRIPVMTSDGKVHKEPGEGDRFQLPLAPGTQLLCEITGVTLMMQDGAVYYKCEWNQADERYGVCTIMGGYVISWSQLDRSKSPIVP